MSEIAWAEELRDNFNKYKDFPRKANLGCGPLNMLSVQDKKYMKVQQMSELKEWLMIDLYIEGPGIKNWDIEKLEEIPNSWLHRIYSSHALEHISHQRALIALHLWWRKLEPEGNITIIVPDLMYAFKQLRAIENDQVPEGLYHEEFGLHSPLSIIYGTHSQPGEMHMGGFTPNLLKTAMEKVGYHRVEVETFYDEHQMDSIIATAVK